MRNSTRPSPNHIAFLAENRNVVRDCYSAALHAGGRPSGAPNYRNEDCTCFNAAVEDHDGNTIEFIFRQPHTAGAGCGEAAPGENDHVQKWREGVEDEDVEEDAHSVAKSMGSKASTAKSRLQTAMSLAKSTSQSVKSGAPPQGVSGGTTTPSSSGFSSKAILGTALGAAAGAALMFALTREEAKNAKEEADHLAFMSSRSTPRSMPPMHESQPTPPPPRAETMPPSLPALSQAPKSEFKDSRRLHHNYSTTESAYSRPVPRSTQAMRMIQETGHNDDGEICENLPRYTHLRPHPTRSHTVDGSTEYLPEYIPAKSNAGSRIKRASTLPIDDEVDRPDYYLEAPKSTVSKHSSRHGSDRDDHKSSVSKHSSRHGSDKDDHRSSVSHRSRASVEDAERLKRHDSGISVHSSRSHRDRGSEAGTRSSASTIRPSRRASDSIPFPPPPIGNHAPSHASRAGSSCYHPAAISLPPSAASSSREDPDVEVKPSKSRRSKSPPPVPAKPYIHERDSVLQSWENFEAEDSDGLGDVKTVLPEDSISCVDLSRPRRHRRSHHHSSKHSSSGRHSRSGRSEAASERTVRPAEKERKGSLLGIPIRSKDGRFSFV